jgi:hypothetical protein
MQGQQLLYNLIENAPSFIHKKTINSVTNAVGSLLIGKELSLTGLARSSKGKAKERHAIRRTDRLLGNKKLHSEITTFYSVLISYLLKKSETLHIVIDWSAVNDKKKWFILRASVTLKGRSHTIYQETHPKQNSAVLEKSFLKKLKMLLPDKKVVIITDAGFRCTWFKAASELDFDWIGRIRNKNKYQEEGKKTWKNTDSLHKKATAKLQRFSNVTLVKSNPVKCDFVLAKKKSKGRKRFNKTGGVSKNNVSKHASISAKEPWLIATSLKMKNKLDEKKIIRLYEKRMQIEEEFRDTKSHRYGFGLRYSLSTIGKRLEVLLLIATLATFLCWLISLSAYQKSRQLDYQSNSIKTGGVLSVTYLACRLVNKEEYFTKKELLASLKQLQKMVQSGAEL